MAPEALTLVYGASSTVKGYAVMDFYVFNTGTTGFVIVAADDEVTPVLAYSTESVFSPDNIPANVADKLDNYKLQISYIIRNNVPATAQTTAKWDMLQADKPFGAAKTTVVGVPPLMHTKWDQRPYCNILCPYDYTADTNALTGCVATAMAQVMKYWNWPAQGTGTHTYSSSYGTLSANFGATTYLWDSMPNYLSANNAAVAKIMYHAGVSVNMHYGVTSSGAYVLASYSPITDCAEYALKTYFKYKPSIHGVYRSSYDDSGWVHLIKSEIDNYRPVMHTGSGPSGGHCFVADGYANDNRIHFNWGWGGIYNGYFIIENLAPGTETFNSDETLLVGIEPDRPVTGVNNVAVTENMVNIYPNPATSEINITSGVVATQVRILDIAGHEVRVVTPTSSFITIPVSDLANGMYVVELQTAQGTIAKKVLISK